jgi:hypothetical protein
MGTILMLSVGALLSGLFLGFKDLLPLMAARRSGSISRRGARDVRVDRDADPEIFDRLLANRSKGAAGGFGIFMAGAVGLSLSWLALVGFGGPLAILIFVFYLCFSAFAAFCLIRGFTTGRMFAFWGMALFGEATRKQNPTWFWIYGALNLLIVLIGVLTLLNAFTR